jgi:hypothetical protein
MDNGRPPNSRATEHLDEFPSPSSRLECDSNVLQLEIRTGLRGNATGPLVRKADKTVVASIRLSGGCEDIKPAQKLMVSRQGKACSSPAVSGSPTIMYCRTTTRRHVPFWNACYRSAMMLACWRRSTILRYGGRSLELAQHRLGATARLRYSACLDLDAVTPPRTGCGVNSWPAASRGWSGSCR